jgi:hypothetical protein
MRKGSVQPDPMRTGSSRVAHGSTATERGPLIAIRRHYTKWTRYIVLANVQYAVKKKFNQIALTE